MKEPLAVDVQGIRETALKVITEPVGFYKQMPKTGGFGAPLVFIAAMGLAAGVIQSIIGIIGLGFGALAAIVVTPIMAAIFGFVAAAVLFAIWRIMGSQESFEAAYRCVAHAGAIMPVTAVLGIIPVIGSALGIVWFTYLIVVASVEVQGVRPNVAWVVFGVLGALLVLGSVSAEMAARRMTREMSKWEERLGDIEEMEPGEAGKAVGEFLKGMQEGLEKLEKEAEN